MIKHLIVFLTIITMINLTITTDSVVEFKLGDNLSKQVINSVMPQVYNSIKNKVKEMKDINIKKKFGIIELELQVSTLSLNNLIYNENDIQVNSTKEGLLTVLLNKINIDINGNYASKTSISHKKTGKFEFQIVCNLKIDLEINTIKHEENNLLQVKVKNIDFQHNILKAFIENNKILSFLIKSSNITIVKHLIDNIISKKIIEIANKSLDQSFNIPNSNLNLSLDKLNFGITILDNLNDKNNVMDIKLGVVINNKSINLYSKKQDALITDIDDSKSIKLSLNSDILELIISFLYSKELFNIKIDNSMIPKSIPYKLNTYYLQNLLPDIYKEYPDKDYDIELQVINNRPEIALDNEQVLLNGRIEVRLNLADTSNLVFLSFRSNFELALNNLPNKEHYKYFLDIKTISVSDTEIVVKCGDITGKDIDETADPLFKMLIYIINYNVLDKGILLPKVKNVDLNKNKIDVTKESFSIEIEPVIA